MKPVKPSFPSLIPADKIGLWKRSLRPNRNYQITTLYREFGNDIPLPQIVSTCDKVEWCLYMMGFGREQ